MFWKRGFCLESKLVTFLLPSFFCFSLSLSVEERKRKEKKEKETFLPMWNVCWEAMKMGKRNERIIKKFFLFLQIFLRSFSFFLSLFLLSFPMEKVKQNFIGRMKWNERKGNKREWTMRTVWISKRRKNGRNKREEKKERRKKKREREKENGMETRIVWKESEKPFLFPYFLSDQHSRFVSLFLISLSLSFLFLSLPLLLSLLMGRRLNQMVGK